MSILFDKFLLIIFIVFVLVISFDPTGAILGIKEILFAFLLICSLPWLCKQKVSKSILFFLLICLSVPMYGIVVAVLKDNFIDTAYAWGHWKSFLFLLIFIFLMHIEFNKILKIMFINGSLIALCTVCIFVIAQINQDLFSTIYDQSVENSNIIISRRIYYGISILGVYFKTGPFMLFSYVYSLYFYNGRWNKLFIILNLSALLMAGSRVPMLMALFLSLMYLYDRFKGNRYIKYILFFFFLSSFSFLTYKLATEKGEPSNDIKFNDFNSYIQTIFSGSTPLVGDGLGSVFFARGRNVMMSNSEQTYMDIFHIYGFIIGGILILAVFYPVIYFGGSKYRYILKYRRFMLAYALYMILAGTNPLLISSTGMLVWAIGLTFVYKIKTNQLYEF